MNISYKWLKEYVDFDLTPQEAADALTSIGLEVDALEEVQTVKGGLKGLYVGKVLTCVEHPNSDHLHVTTVDLGKGEPQQIVCGAPNVAAGQKVIVADLGCVLYDDLREAYLHPEAATALVAAQRKLKQLRPDLSLKVYDAARPMRIQQKMWNQVKKTAQRIYVSNPAHGGGLHNYGLAVDITLCTLKGDSIPMGTKVDHLGREAHIDIEAQLVAERKISQQARKNRQLLREVMRSAGFKPLRTEWWHFNFKSRAEAKQKYRVIE